MGYVLGPMLYSSGANANVNSTSSAITAEVGSVAYQRTVLTKLHHFGRAGYVTRPVLLACMFGVAGMILTPVVGLGPDAVTVFNRSHTRWT